jgi:hypothetical protein
MSGDVSAPQIFIGADWNQVNACPSCSDFFDIDNFKDILNGDTLRQGGRKARAPSIWKAELADGESYFHHPDFCDSWIATGESAECPTCEMSVCLIR